MKKQGNLLLDVVLSFFPLFPLFAVLYTQVLADKETGNILTFLIIIDLVPAMVCSILICNRHASKIMLMREKLKRNPVILIVFIVVLPFLLGHLFGHTKHKY